MKPLRILICALLAILIAVSCLLPMNGRGSTIALLALGERGKPYVFGSAGPKSYDCSGLVKAAYEKLGIELSHSAQYVGYNESYPTIEAANDLRVGDLVFFDTVEDRDACDHVGIWLGANRFVHASSSEGIVMISSFDEDWPKRFSWGKRIL